MKHPTSVLSIAHYVELRRTKLNRKELKIDRPMDFGQSRLIDGYHVAEVMEDLLATPPPPCWPIATAGLG